MERYFSPEEIDYHPLFEFLSELNLIDHSPENPDNPGTPQNIAYRFSYRDGTAYIDLQQYTDFCREMHFIVALDGDPYVVSSFIRCFSRQTNAISIPKLIENSIADLSIEQISSSVDLIQKCCLQFKAVLCELCQNAIYLYNKKGTYYRGLENEAISNML